MKQNIFSHPGGKGFQAVGIKGGAALQVVSVCPWQYQKN